MRSRLKSSQRSSEIQRKCAWGRLPDRYIDSVKSPDGCVLRSNREIRDAFRAHFRDRFGRCPNLPLQEFHSYLADFPRLQEAEAAGCEVLVTECEVRDALKQVGFNKSPGLDGLPYEVYLRLPHMFGRASGSVRCVHLTLDPLPIVCTSSACGSSAGATTIPHQIVLGRSKADGPQTGLHSDRSAYTQWWSRYAWSGQPPARWKAHLLGPILVGGRGVETKGERFFPSIQIRPKGRRST